MSGKVGNADSDTLGGDDPATGPTRAQRGADTQAQPRPANPVFGAQRLNQQANQPRPANTPGPAAQPATNPPTDQSQTADAQGPGLVTRRPARRLGIGAGRAPGLGNPVKPNPGGPDAPVVDDADDEDEPLRDVEQGNGEGDDPASANESSVDQEPVPADDNVISITTTTTQTEPVRDDTGDVNETPSRSRKAPIFSRPESMDRAKSAAQDRPGPEKELDSSSEESEPDDPRGEKSTRLSPGAEDVNTIQPQVQPSIARAQPTRELKRRANVYNLVSGVAGWAIDIAKATNVPLPSSQQRLASEGLATAANIAASKTHDGKDKAQAQQLAQVLKSMPNELWTIQDAMTAAAAKVQLDMLSIPPAARKLAPLGEDMTSANKTFWIENQAADGSKSKAFLCKPMSAGATTKSMPSGGPKGGEVAREALAGRAAHFLDARGIGIGMPETHVVQIDPSWLPGNNNANTPTTCSVQQFGASVGPLGAQTYAARKQIDAKKVAGLAVFDMMTLANDRHPGNILMGANGELIPIDHGENFTEVGNAEALLRLPVTLAGPANALLSIPSAHDPMPEEVRSKAVAINPSEFRDVLKADRDEIAKAHGSLEDMISDTAIDGAARAAEFTKRAAKAKVSAAAAQVALGAHAKELLDPALSYAEFSKNADAIVKVAHAQQKAVKDVCLCSNADYHVLCEKVERSGWAAQRRGATTGDRSVGDPMMMIAILTNNLKPLGKKPFPKIPKELEIPKGKNKETISADLKQRRKAYKDQKDADWEKQQQDFRAATVKSRDEVTPETTAQKMLEVCKDAIAGMLALLPDDKKLLLQQKQANIENNKASSTDFVGDFRELSHEATEVTLAHLRAEFDQIEKAGQLHLLNTDTEIARQLPGSYMQTLREFDAGNPMLAADGVKSLREEATAARSLLAISAVYQTYFDRFKVPDNDPKWRTFMAAMNKGDVALAFNTFLPFRADCKANAFKLKVG